MFLLQRRANSSLRLTPVARITRTAGCMESFLGGNGTRLRSRITIFGGIVLAFSMFIGSSASAACPEPKKEVTLINPAGKVIVLCVPEQAIPHIGGRGVKVIPAACPCKVCVGFNGAVLSSAPHFDPQCLSAPSGHRQYDAHLGGGASVCRDIVGNL